MGYGSTLNNKLMTVLNKMFENQDLCKLLYYTSPNPLAEANISNTKVLLDKNIIPKPFVTSVISDVRSIVIIYFDRFTFDRTFETGFLNFDILVHESLWKINGGLRVQSIFEELEKSFNRQRILGLGEIQIVSYKLAVVNDAYKGYSVSFRFTDFN